MNNFGPPPLQTPNVKLCVTSAPAQEKEASQSTTIKITTDSQYPRPFFAFFFSGPVLDATAGLERGAFGYSPTRAEKLPNPENSAVIRVNTINFSTSTWFPSDGAITVTVPSKTPVSLIRTLAGGGDDPDKVFNLNLIYGCE